MINYIIIAVLAIMVFFMLRSSIKHFKGEGGCCGGGGGIIEDNKKLTSTEIGSKTISISGMSCDNCRIRVKNALNRIDGLTAEVDLKKSTAELHYSREISDDEIRRAVEDAGYKLED